VATLAVLVLPALMPSAEAQTDLAPCGYVDRFDLPVPDIDLEYTDFGVYRAQFGGLHTGIDVAFEQLGNPVQAAARGLVTYSDPEGWDTEKGVVVIQHTMPDGTLVNSLYGHMEELNGHTFPEVDQCVERGDVIGAIGFPSRGRPHLHFEVRTRYRSEGGPGYTSTNPLELGWYHPLDFVYLANIWVLPAYRSHFSLFERPLLPPLPLADGTYVIAHSQYVEAITPDGQSLWRFDIFDSATGLLALPDGRVLALTSTGQVLIVNNGNYSASWQISGVKAGPLLFGSRLVFMLENNTLAAFSPDGSPLWQSAPLDGRLEQWAISADRLAVTTKNNQLTILDAGGSVLVQATFPDLAIPAATAEGEFLLLHGSTVARIDQSLTITPAFDTGRPVASGARLVPTTSGAIYIYTGEGRSLYAYAPDGTLLWIAYMPGSQLRPPLLGMGGGQLIYALTTDGQLLAYATSDGHLVAQLALYNGGADGVTLSRWLDVQPDDTVRFASGYLTTVTISGLDLLTPASP
jgi:outer membrane protein assembly factor BamB